MDETVADLIARYIQGRDLLERMKREHKAKEERLASWLRAAEARFAQVLERDGLQHISSPAGTVYRTERVRASVEDWDTFLAWVRANDGWEFLERRVCASPVKEMLEGEQRVPPGVRVFREHAVNVRRA